ncbi:peptidase M23B [Parvibaculum lavamentivorans DS-1]|uniref:Peptidase M23B n=1 Tax=Parvibaculum lavamentivorans (strain DS-1 / DSM 13023 / NCIMB 13966) TaxID=402881 RepID=A7HXK7_PARL1|nr:M23 family metallopeptidase [Parvibaculum lavamentivorans]ABS64640.1 peptidase M23B [Parvibaculum lavamentivorans DS-1]
MRRHDHMRRMGRWAGVLALALFVAACGSRERPWWDGGPSGAQSGSSAAAPRPIERVSPGGTYVVKRGDTVYSIARAHDVPLRSIIDTNGLRPPYDIRVGQKLSIPAGRFHVVQRGETVYSISRLYNVDTTSLTSLNRIQPPYTIKVGEKLQVPSRATQTAASPSGAGTPLARPGAVAAPSSAPATTTTAVTVPKSPLPEPPAATGSFEWPVQGKILSSFGPKANGLHNDGVNIAAETGAPVKASQSGVVAYAGNELKGYGNLLLVRHENDWITAYAHNSKLLVQRGDKVVRGQTISLAGNSGSVVTPQVHFEVRKGSKALDPLTVIGR